MRRSVFVAVLMSLVALVAAACSSKTNNTTTGGTPSAGASGTGGSNASTSGITPASTLTSDGSTFAQPLYMKWDPEFAASNHIQDSYSGTGSSKGISDLTAKVVDWAGTDAPYTTSTTGILNVPTALGAVAVTYNLPTVPNLQLSAQTLADIFQGKIAAWNNAEIKTDNPSATLPNTPITIVHRSDGSGTTFIFSSFLSNVSASFKSTVGASTSPSWPTTAQFKAGAKSTGVDQAVKATPGSIGYVELTYAIQTNTKNALIQNADKTAYLAPTVSTTAAAAAAYNPAAVTGTAGPGFVFNILNEPGAQSYPIAGPTYAILYQAQSNGPKGQAVVDYLNWGLTTGQADEAALDYVALPTAIQQKAIAVLKTVTYNGTALLS